MFLMFKKDASENLTNSTYITLNRYSLKPFLKKRQLLMVTNIIYNGIAPIGTVDSRQISTKTHNI